MRAENWQAMLDLAEKAGLLPPDMRQKVERVCAIKQRLIRDTAEWFEQQRCPSELGCNLGRDFAADRPRVALLAQHFCKKEYLFTVEK